MARLIIMPRREDDATVWIGYADFLTTLVVLFFVVAVVFAGKLAKTRPGYLMGTVTEPKTDKSIESCLVKLGAGRQQRTSTAGQFEFRVDSLRDVLTLGLMVRCEGYREYSEPVSLRPADTTRVVVRLERVTSVEVETLPGDALFPPDGYNLKAEAADTIAQLGKQLKNKLTADRVIAVQGHSDDVPYPPGSGKDNWVLSAQRATAAAKILTNPEYGVGLSPCQVAIMGFGPSRPVQPVVSGDSPPEKREKRRANRRIEFRILKGSELSGGRCVE
jgi:flagellar motor protein MotB